MKIDCWCAAPWLVSYQDPPRMRVCVEPMLYYVAPWQRQQFTVLRLGVGRVGAIGQ